MRDYGRRARCEGRGAGSVGGGAWEEGWEMGEGQWARGEGQEAELSRPESCVVSPWRVHSAVGGRSLNSSSKCGTSWSPRTVMEEREHRRLQQVHTSMELFSSTHCCMSPGAPATKSTSCVLAFPCMHVHLHVLICACAAGGTSAAPMQGACMHGTRPPHLPPCMLPHRAWGRALLLFSRLSSFGKEHIII